MAHKTFDDITVDYDDITVTYDGEYHSANPVTEPDLTFRTYDTSRQKFNKMNNKNKSIETNINQIPVIKSEINTTKLQKGWTHEIQTTSFSETTLTLKESNTELWLKIKYSVIFHNNTAYALDIWSFWQGNKLTVKVVATGTKVPVTIKFYV